MLLSPQGFWLCHCQKMGQRELAIVFRVRGVECDSSCFQWPCVLVEFLTDASALLKRVRKRWSSLGCALFGLRNTPLQITGVEWGKLVSRKHTGQPAAVAAWRSCFLNLDQNRPIAASAAVATRMCSAAAVSCWVRVVRRGQTAESLRGETLSSRQGQPLCQADNTSNCRGSSHLWAT